MDWIWLAVVGQGSWGLTESPRKGCDIFAWDSPEELDAELVQEYVHISSDCPYQYGSGSLTCGVVRI